MFNRSKKYSMSKTESNQTLQNVFDACNVAPNSVPFDKIMFKSMTDTKSITFLKRIAVVFLVIVIASPLFFKRDKSFTVVNQLPGRQVVVTDHQLYENAFSMTLLGNGILYDDITSMKANGAIVFPSSVDPANGVVVFPYDGSALSISIPTSDGNTLNAIVAEKTK